MTKRILSFEYLDDYASEMYRSYSEYVCQKMTLDLAQLYEEIIGDLDSKLALFGVEPDSDRPEGIG